MNRFIFNPPVLIIYLILLSSCSSMYIPPMPNIPLLKEKGEIQIDLGTSTNSVYLSGDYAFSNDFALQVNGNMSFYNFSKHYDLFTDEETDRIGEMFTPDYDYGEFAHRYGELGLGKYDLLKSKWKLEMFAGTGYGTGTEKVGDMNSRYYLGFVQGNLGRRLINHNFEFGFTCRIAYSNFNLSYFEYPYIDKMNIAFDNIHIEPAAFLRVGSRSIRFYGKIGLNIMHSFGSFDGIDLSRGIKDGELNYTSSHISIGINYKFGQINNNKAAHN